MARRLDIENQTVQPWKREMHGQLVIMVAAQNPVGIAVAGRRVTPPQASRGLRPERGALSIFYERGILVEPDLCTLPLRHPLSRSAGDLYRHFKYLFSLYPSVVFLLLYFPKLMEVVPLVRMFHAMPQRPSTTPDHRLLPGLRRVPRVPRLPDAFAEAAPVPRRGDLRPRASQGTHGEITVARQPGLRTTRTVRRMRRGASRDYQYDISIWSSSR